MDKNIIPTEVVAALIWEGSRFLICQRPRHKVRGSLWEFVGGKVEPGESKEEALIRECREELSITVQPGEVFMEATDRTSIEERKREGYKVDLGGMTYIG